jgi:hypothetical protein
MPSAYTNISKPTGANYIDVNPQGREQYDDWVIAYDDTGIYYDGTDENAYTSISKPTGSTYTSIAKPTT